MFEIYLNPVNYLNKFYIEKLSDIKEEKEVLIFP